MQKPKGKGNLVTLIIMLVMLAIVFGLKKCKDSKQTYPERTTTTVASDWRNHKLVYTKHARCRMDCRQISEAEVEYILASGTINEEKSKEENDEATGHCPSFALEGNTKDGQHVRIVYGAYDKITKVITAIDLDNEHQCECR